MILPWSPCRKRCCQLAFGSATILPPRGHLEGDVAVEVCQSCVALLYCSDGLLLKDHDWAFVCIICIARCTRSIPCVTVTHASTHILISCNAYYFSFATKSVFCQPVGIQLNMAWANMLRSPACISGRGRGDFPADRDAPRGDRGPPRDREGGDRAPFGGRGRGPRPEGGRGRGGGRGNGPLTPNFDDAQAFPTLSMTTAKAS